MVGSLTYYLSLRRLQSAPDMQPVLGMMVATNDIALANAAFDYYGRTLTGTDAHKKVGVSALEHSTRRRLARGG